MAMEGMHRMQEAHDKLKQKDALRNPVTGEHIDLDADEYDKSLADILGNERDHELFVNRFLYAGRDADQAKDIVEALANETLLTKEQNTFLEKARQNFNKMRVEVAAVKELLTAEELGRIARLDKRIGEVVGKIGIEKAEKLLDDQFEELAISNPKEFQKVAQRFKNLQQIRDDKETVAIEKKTGETLRARGISEEKYWEATVSGVGPESDAKLRKLVVENYSAFQKAINFVSFGALANWDRSKLSTNLQDQERILKGCNQHLAAIGRVLQGTLTPEVDLAIQKAMMQGGSVEDKKEENNVATIGDYRRVKDYFSPDKRQERWEQYKKTEGERKSPPGLDEMKNGFTDREWRRQQEHKPVGLIAALLALIFGTKDDIKNSLK